MDSKPRRDETGSAGSFPPAFSFSSFLHFLLDSDFFFCHTRLMGPRSAAHWVQGRRVEEADLDQIRQLTVAHPAWSRWRLSRELAAQWNWRNPTGQLKDMATRSLL